MKRRVAATIGLIALAPGSAEAHIVQSGMGPVYDGVSHFGMSPVDFLPVVALAFLAGLRGPRHARVMLAAVSGAWLLAGAMALAGFALPAIAHAALTALVFLAVGGLLAANADLPPSICAGVAACVGLVCGAGDTAGVAGSPDHALSLIGTTASVFVMFALAASVTLPLRRHWMIVAARVGGSWLAALGLLFAGWILRYGARVQ